MNLRGPFLCMKYAIPALMRSGGGSIVNIASPTGIHGRAARYTAYSSSKGGLISLTRATAVGYARDRIRVNAIVPGPTDTPLVAARLAREPPRDDPAAVCGLGGAGRGRWAGSGRPLSSRCWDACCPLPARPLARLALRTTTPLVTPRLPR